MRSGFVERRLPTQRRLASSREGGSWALRFEIGRIRSGYERLADVGRARKNAVIEADRILRGEMRFYGWSWREVGWPPRWHVDSFSGYEYPRVHWRRIPDNDAKSGDIKDVWEISRLAFTFAFARAWVLTDDDRYPCEWWRAVEDWAEHNPPNQGVNWKCGQETSLRGIALQFGMSVFGDHSATTPQRAAIVAELLRVSTDRVQATLHYARSQRNNHAISEAVFLETTAIGTGVVGGAPRSGRRALIEAVDDQFYDDGWYAQHSFNYQRLAVHALVWLERVRMLAELAPVAAVQSALARSASLLNAAQDPASGRLPNLGANDSALLFPLTACAQQDFRPVLNTLEGEGGAAAGEDHGPWAEEAIWLGAHGLIESRVAPKSREAHLVTLSGPRSRMMVRTGPLRHRPGHDDTLHVDLWLDGENLLADPGTFRYSAQRPWNNALRGARVHNVPRAAGESELRVGRFLSLAWRESRCVRRRILDPSAELVELELHNDASSYRRTIIRRGDHYVIADTGREPFVTRWTLGAEAHVTRTGLRMDAETLGGCLSVWGEVAVLSASDDDPSTGWLAPHYAQRLATTALEVRSSNSMVLALVGPGGRESLDERLERFGVGSGEAPTEEWLASL